MQQLTALGHAASYQGCAVQTCRLIPDLCLGLITVCSEAAEAAGDPPLWKAYPDPLARFPDQRLLVTFFCSYCA